MFRVLTAFGALSRSPMWFNVIELSAGIARAENPGVFTAIDGFSHSVVLF